MVRNGIRCRCSSAPNAACWIYARASNCSPTCGRRCCSAPLAEASSLKRELVEDLDILIVRELTGGIYFGKPRGIEKVGNLRRGFNTDVYDEAEIARIGRVAFDLARKRSRRVCSVDKANVLEVTQLWRDVMKEVAADYPDVELSHMYVDNAGMQLVRRPKQFDVIVTGNMFGDILSDVAAMLTGSLGMLPSASLGADGRGLYEPVHGSAPDIAGRGISNPLATILSVGMMFRYTFGAIDVAARIDRAVQRVLELGLRTRDILPEDATGLRVGRHGRDGSGGPGCVCGRRQVMRQVNVAVVGATGAVGEAMVEILAERNFPVKELHLLASERSEGSVVRFGGRSVRVKRLDQFDFSGVDIGLFSAGASVSADFAPKAAAAGCVVIDNTSQFRYDDDIPLVVPEVNPHAIAQRHARGIIANPNCSTIQMVVALKPIFDAVGIERINVATYQSVSGAGAKGIRELAGQTADLLNAKPIEPKAFSRQIAFNVIPHIDVFQDNGYTKEEMKMVWETRKILEAPDMLVNPTCVRVPVFYGHSEAVHIETRVKLSAADARALLSKAPGVQVLDERKNGGYPTAVVDAAGQDPVWVGRIREDISHPRGLDLWIVSDNVRKGAALNSVQIAELLLKEQQ